MTNTISTLVQHRSEQQHHTSEQKMRAIGRVGQAVNLAVERFVTVGETIADDNPEIKQDMYDACKEARAAGYPGIIITKSSHPIADTYARKGKWFHPGTDLAQNQYDIYLKSSGDGCRDTEA
uniref:Uncharacterized protein n=1 Tax=Anopheles culicifacies TaxID=139723 RepID=A0A182MFR4_9DIPT